MKASILELTIVCSIFVSLSHGAAPGVRRPVSLFETDRLTQNLLLRSERHSGTSSGLTANQNNVRREQTLDEAAYSKLNAADLRPVPLDMCEVRGASANKLMTKLQQKFMADVQKNDVVSGCLFESSCSEPGILNSQPQFSEIAVDQAKAASAAVSFRNREWPSTMWAASNFGQIYRAYLVRGSWPREKISSGTYSKQEAFGHWAWGRAIPGRGLFWGRMNTTHFESFWGRDPSRPRLWHVWRIEYYEGKPHLQDLVLLRTIRGDQSVQSPIAIGDRIHQQVLYNATLKIPVLIEYFPDCSPGPCIHEYEVRSS